MKGYTVKFAVTPLHRKIERAVDRGLTAAMAVIQARLIEKLSHPGGGRVYIRGKKTVSASGKTYRKVSKTWMRKLRKLGISPKRTKGGRVYITQSEAMRVFYDDAQRRSAKGKSIRNLREIGLHRASAPGQPPAADTGTLRRSWQMGSAIASRGVEGSRRTYRIGSAVRYAMRMEYGGSDSRGVYIAPRPYVRPTLEEAGPEAMAAFAAIIRQELNMEGKADKP